MSGTGDMHTDEKPKDKNKRNVMSLLGKAEVLEEFGWRMCTAVVRNHCGVKESITHFIMKNEEQILENIMSYSNEIKHFLCNFF
jgi:hypothetical protein